MEKPIVDILAETLGSLDGYTPNETLPSYHVEARQIIEGLGKRGVGLVRLTNEVEAGGPEAKDVAW